VRSLVRVVRALVVFVFAVFVASGFVVWAGEEADPETVALSVPDEAPVCPAEVAVSGDDSPEGRESPGKVDMPAEDASSRDVVLADAVFTE